MTASRSTQWIARGVAAGITFISAFIPLSYDETYWLGIWRMWSQGAHLYATAIDNKSPLVYLTFGVLDAMPGSVQVARAVLIGIIILVLARAAERARPAPADESRLLFPFAVGTIGLLAGFTMQTELLAAPFAIWSLTWGIRKQPSKAGISAVLATCVSPLAAGFIPVSLALGLGAEPRGFRRAIIVTAGLVATVAIVVVVVDDLRFGLIELNIASREALGSLTGADQAAERTALTVVSVLPIAVIGYLRRWRWNRISKLLLIAAPVVVAGWHPHYWILPTVAATSFYGQKGSERPVGRRARIFMTLSLVPLVAWSSFWIMRGVQRANVYSNVVEALAPLQSQEWTFAQFDLQPDVAAAYPDRVALRGPSINYLIWETSRTLEHRAELPRVLQAVNVLIEPRLEDPETRIPDDLVNLVATFREAIDGFDCSAEVEHLRIHLRASLCPPAT